jgi:hypothetical protein
MTRITLFILASLLAALPAAAQYPGQVTKSSQESPELRAIAVLEWTGEAGKPKASRMVPIAVLDGGVLQDGGIYLARPVPMAVSGAVEYELQQNGKPVGLFDIRNAGQEQGSWVGHGSWKPLPVVKPKPSAEQLAQTKIDGEESDRPVLHRKQHSDESPGATGSDKGKDSRSSSSEPAPAADPDRPTLHKKTSSDSTGSGGSTGSTAAGDASSAGSTAAGSTSAADPDRPTLKKNKKKQTEDVGYVDSLPDVTDPDRPTLKRGKSTGDGLEMAPTLMGLPAEMQQVVAVSDAKTRPEHLWTYSWANPDDEAKMKSALEEIARSALGLNPPAAPPSAAAKRATSRKSAKPAPASTPAPPAPLVDENFRVFQLAYGSGATLVLTARSDGALAQQKFVTLVAQPDLYGNLQVLVKSITDGVHLDESPRLQLIDAVDAMADNRGELLFELRGLTQRQFALYRILRGQAQKLLVTGSEEFGTSSNKAQ